MCIYIYICIYIYVYIYIYIYDFLINKLSSYFRCALDAQHLQTSEHEHLMVSDEEQSDLTFLKSLSKKEKKKLLL